MTRQSPRSVLKTRQYALHGNNPIQPSIARLTKHPAMASATQAARKRIQLHGARYLPHLGPILVSARYAGTPILTENINEMPKERPISRTDDPGPVSVIATTAQTIIVTLRRSIMVRRPLDGMPRCSVAVPRITWRGSPCTLPLLDPVCR